MERTGVIIVAGGSGSRAGGARPKQFRFLGGMPVLARTINTFAAALPGAEIVAVLPEQHIGFWKNLSARFDVAEHKIAAGGAERFHSVRNGLAALTSDPGLIAVQDGVRPLGSVAMIRRVAEAAAKHGAAIPVVEPVDSFWESIRWMAMSKICCTVTAISHLPPFQAGFHGVQVVGHQVINALLHAFLPVRRLFRLRLFRFRGGGGFDLPQQPQDQHCAYGSAYAGRTADQE